MFRPALVAVVLLAGVAVGSAVGVGSPGSDVDAGGATDDTGIDVTFEDSEVSDGETVNLTVSGTDSGTQIEITSEAYPPSLLERMIGGKLTADGVRVPVPDSRTIPVDFAPAACHLGDVQFTVRRLDTGETASGSVTVSRYSIAKQSFSRGNFTVRQGGSVSIRTVTNCHGVGVHIWDPNSPFNATVVVEDDRRNSTVVLDTAHPTNASRLFGTAPGANVTNATITAPPERLHGRYQLTVFSLAAFDDGSRIAGFDVDDRPQKAWLTVTTRSDESTPSMDGNDTARSVPVTASPVQTTEGRPATREPTTTVSPNPQTRALSSTESATAHSPTSVSPTNTIAGDGPGFGPLVAFTALVALAALAVRRV